MYVILCYVLTTVITVEHNFAEGCEFTGNYFLFITDVEVYLPKNLK